MTPCGGWFGSRLLEEWTIREAWGTVGYIAPTNGTPETSVIDWLVRYQFASGRCRASQQHVGFALGYMYTRLNRFRRNLSRSRGSSKHSDAASNASPALVRVYQKLLEFYNAAYEILSRKGVKLVIKLVLENGHLPGIVSDFLRHADFLRKLVQKATWEIVEDIKTMLYDCEIARWLGNGKMSRQSQHHAYLQEIRADKACEFLLADAKFIDWYHANEATDYSRRQLVILGEMGSGKSVAMALLIDELRRRNEQQLPQPKICYHYCQNDASGQAIYVFSVLILSLLEQLPGLKRTFFEWYKRTMTMGTEPAASFKALEGWLQNTLATLDRPLIFAIDGLDECDRQSRVHLLTSLGTLSKKAPRLKILLSSRPEEEILEQLTGVSSTIAMGSDAARDYLIVEKTVGTRLFYLAADVKALVIEALSRSAQGSAIWTRMTVELIEIRGIKALSPMRDFLDKVPQPRQLAELYANVYSRYTADDPENQQLAATALEILAVARRPLSILELGWAVALGAAYPGTAPTVDALSKLVDHQRVMSLIQPFVAHVDFGDVTNRQVRLVHQSVKEFIFGPWSLNRPSASGSPSLGGISAPSASIQQRTERLEAGLLAICIRYLLLHEINNVGLFSAEHLALEELPQDSDLFNDDNGNQVPANNDYDPCCSWEAWEQDAIHYNPTERGFGELFIYASCHWVEHFGAVSAEPLLASLSDIELLCGAGSTRLHNWIAQNCRPGCAIKPRFEFDGTLYDPLSITCLYGSETMLRRMLEDSQLDEMNAAFLPSPAMGAADQILRWGELPRLKLLWDSKAGHQIRNMDFFRFALGQWSGSPSDKHRPGWDMVFGLLEDVYDKLAEERWGSTLLRMAAGTGCIPVVRRLMDAAQHRPQLRAELLDMSQSVEKGPIGAAVLGNHADIVEYLLSQQGIEAHLQRHNACGENLLHLASRLCNPAMFRLLVPRLKDNVYQRDKQGDTVLMRIIMSSSASSKDRRESARILLSEIGAADGRHFMSLDLDDRQEALRIVTRLSNLNTCRLLDNAGH
ncbi:hypothetical protein B0T19DRAFT_439454 [Cercophora scortea]|uniref:NACHT domain-containing protein n=1 Tax=Cercophora scortea TaxID=314031 RepID=A0AAE0IWN7_9PEZI|nr:hypothetical protein B0T19DRAFT_439454 [Cercophora scortea]